MQEQTRVNIFWRKCSVACCAGTYSWKPKLNWCGEFQSSKVFLQTTGQFAPPSGQVRPDLPTKKPAHFLSYIPSGNFPCLDCVHCSGLIKGKSFPHPRTGKEVKVRGRIMCNTTFVVYLLKCPCNLFYVGKTKRALKTRIGQHKCSIRRQDSKSSVARHFNAHNHSDESLRYMGIEVVSTPSRSGDREKLLLQRECFWIHCLDTLEPKGLNEEITLSCFLWNTMHDSLSLVMEGLSVTEDIWWWHID